MTPTANPAVPAEKETPRVLSPEGLQAAISSRQGLARIYLPGPEGCAPATKVYEGRATAGPEHSGQLLLSSGVPTIPEINRDDWRELWPAPEARDPRMGLTALSQALAELEAAATTLPTEPPTPAWTPGAAAALANAVAAVYYAISHSPEIPGEDNPARVSISRPDGIPYALTKLFQLQKELPELIPANKEASPDASREADSPVLPIPMPPDHQELLAQARTDLEGVIQHWQSPNY